MSVKKNLTVAALAALLAVPAFGATNAHAASGVRATYEGPSVNIGDGEPEGQYNPGRKLTVYPKYQLDGNYSSSMGWVPKKDVKFDNGSNGAANGNTMTNGSESGADASANGNQSEYQNSKTNNGKLVQTGENDGASKAAALGATALTASIGLTALSFAKKHKDLEAVNLATDNASVADGKGNDDDKPHYSDKSSYDMIMSDMFDSLSQDLK